MIRFVRKPGLTSITAFVLIVLSVGLALARRAIVEEDIEGPPGTGSWRITLIVTGTLDKSNASVTVMEPPDFRHQRVIQEQDCKSDLLETRTAKGKESSVHRAVWHALKPGPVESFRLSCMYRAFVGVHHPTQAMLDQTHALDGSHTTRDALKPSRLIPREGKIKAKADDIVADLDSPTDLDKARAFFAYVRDQIEPEPTTDPISAQDCLRNQAGNSGGKSRLLVALCRSQDIPARLVSGLILGDDTQPRLHYWAEAWVKVDDHSHWLPMCPSNNHLGLHELPREYLVLHLGDDDPVHAEGGTVKFGFLVRNLLDSPDQYTERQPSWLKAQLLRFQLTNLRSVDRFTVKFLLLLPLAALIVSFFRTVIGIPTYGTFSPALVGLAFLDLKSLRVGLAVFVLTVLVGWAMRRLLERYHLLQVPRTAALLTLIVAFLLVAIVISSSMGIVVTHVIALFPLVILTHLVERFWTIEAEDSTYSSFGTLLGTLVVAVAVSLSLSHEWLSNWMLRYPETLGVVFAAQLLLGRYTGYRLSELYRFADIIKHHEATNGPGETKGVPK